MDAKEVGLFIATKRNARNLSQGALAKMAGISRPYMTQIETGKRIPSENTLSAILGALGLTPVDVVLHFSADDDPEVQRMLEVVQFLQLVEGKLTDEERATWRRLFSDPHELREWMDQVVPPEPTPPAPVGWSDLATNDRRLVQRLINRLLSAGTGADDGDD